MTTYFPFAPSSIIAPVFYPILDGDSYTCSVTWNLYGQRYYLNCFDQSGSLIFSVANVESQSSIQLQSLSWNSASLFVTAITTIPMTYDIGSIIEFTIDNCAPVSYNGRYRAIITSENSFTYTLQDDPGQMSVAGQVSYLINLCKGYFTTSTIVFRSAQFEVSP